MLRAKLIALAFSLAAGCAPALAQVMAEPLPGDPNLVVFPYDENNSYRILARPNSVTHVVLEADERLKVLALGDTISWQTSRKDNNIFIKPTYPGRTTSGTLITTKRAYQLMLISTNEQGRWYQRVSFQYPDLVVQEALEADRARLEQEIAQAGGDHQQASGRTPVSNLPPPYAGAMDATASEGRFIDPASLNFNYKIEGQGNFRPVTVYDDGKATFVKLPADADVPALFRIMRSDAQLIEYTLRPGNVLVTPRVLDAMLLKLGKEEVRIFNLTKVKRSFFGGIDLGE